jgi:predicted metal-binding membrane protein
MEDSSGSAFAPAVLKSWSQRKNLLPGLALVTLAAAGWVYVAYQSSPMSSTESMAMDGSGGGVIFLSGWTAMTVAMMVAMMVPATLPLILLYRTIAHNRLSSAQAQVGMVALLAGYVAVWAATGIPGYAYAQYAEAAGSLAAVLPASLLIVGGAYQFTPLKRICHARCSSPLFFLLRNWRPGATGALRLEQ